MVGKAFLQIQLQQEKWPRDASAPGLKIQRLQQTEFRLRRRCGQCHYRYRQTVGHARAEPLLQAAKDRGKPRALKTRMPVRSAQHFRVSRQPRQLRILARLKTPRRGQTCLSPIAWWQKPLPDGLPQIFYRRARQPKDGGRSPPQPARSRLIASEDDQLREHRSSPGEPVVVLRSVFFVVPTAIEEKATGGYAGPHIDNSRSQLDA